MSKLILRFQINLEDHDLGVHREAGPIFHRWLPNGTEDATQLDTTDPNAELKVWFERLGFVEDHKIRFSYERSEVDQAIMSTQARLSGGPLFGSLELVKISEEEIAVLQQDRKGDSLYLALGKRVAKLIHGPVAQFLDVLRTNYGQYWLRERQAWDSMRKSIGAYCSSLRLMWSLDDGDNWAGFLPDDPVVHLTTTLRSEHVFSEYLTAGDWRKLEETVRQHRPSLAASLLARAHRLLDQGDLKYAYIEAVTAFEIAIRQYIRNKLTSDKTLQEAIQSFFTIPTKAQGVLVPLLLGRCSPEDISRAIQAIETRNAIVHEGDEPPPDGDEELGSLLRVVSTLLSGPAYKFPSLGWGNMWKSVERSEQAEELDERSGSEHLSRNTLDSQDKE